MFRAIQILSGIVAATMLSGCVAAVLPALAVGAMAQSQFRGSKDTEAPVGPVSAPIAALVAAPAAAPEARAMAAEAAAATAMQAPPPVYAAAATVSAALPLPIDVEQRATSTATALPVDLLGLPPEHAAFVTHVIRRSALVAEGAPVSSLVVANGLTVREIQYVRCGTQVPAVLVDLDISEVGPPDVQSGMVADPAMVAALSAIRAQGVTVLWVTDHGASASATISTLLRMSGLDPDGEDVVLAAASVTDRKQLRRFVAASRYCILAVTGDRRSDADEAYDYLRDPNTPLVIDANWGSGWYILPPPLHAASMAPPAEASENALEP